MSNVLCIYYSRSGKTKKAMEEIAQALDAELVELHDDVERGGLVGWLRCGMDSRRKTTQPLSPFETEKRLQDYDLVVLGTPVWAGRCSSVMRTFLKAHGRKLERVAYVVTRGSDGRNEDVYDQMDLYTARPRLAAASLRSGSVGYTFWQEEFLRQTREILSAN